MVENLGWDQNLLTWTCKEYKVNILKVKDKKKFIWLKMKVTFWTIFPKLKESFVKMI